MKQTAVPRASRTATLQRLGKNDGRRFSQAARPSRCAKLVADHPQLFLFPRQAQSGAQKVFAASVVNPRSAQNNVRASAGDNRRVALELGPAINAQWTSGVILVVGN